MVSLKKLFKKGSTLSCGNDKHTSSPNNNGNFSRGVPGPQGTYGASVWNAFAKSAKSPSSDVSTGPRTLYSSGHAVHLPRDIRGSNGTRKSAEGPNCKAPGGMETFEGQASSPRANGFDGYTSLLAPRANGIDGLPRTMNSVEPGRDSRAKVMQVLGATPDELGDAFANGAGRGHPGSPEDKVSFGPCYSDSEDEEFPAKAEGQSIYLKPENLIPSSFEFSPAVVGDGRGSSEIRVSPEHTPQPDARNASSQFGSIARKLEVIVKPGGDIIGEFREAASAFVDKKTGVYRAQSLPVPGNCHLSLGGSGSLNTSDRSPKEFCHRDKKFSPTGSEAGKVDTNGVNHRTETTYALGSISRRQELENGTSYRSPPQSPLTSRPQSPRRQCRPQSPLTSRPRSPRGQCRPSPPTSRPQSPRGQCRPQSPLTCRAQSPRGQCSPRGQMCAPNSGISWGSPHGSPGSASPQEFWPDRNLSKGHPLPAPPLQQCRNVQTFSNQLVQQKERGQPSVSRAVSQCGTPRNRSPLSPAVSPRPSPPRFPLRCAPVAFLTLPPSPRSPLPAPPQLVPEYISPPKSPRQPRTPVNWKKVRQIGKGAFGVVYEGLNLDDGSFFAVKVSHGETINPEIQKEIDVLTYLKHPNVVQYYGTGQDDGRQCIFLELMQNSLAEIIQHVECFNETVISTYTGQILQGLEYLHKRNTIHRDIKCSNILVDKDGQIKLADFGLARVVGLDLATSIKGTPVFMAPEVMRPDEGHERGYGLAVDIWSLGCTVIEMASGKPPWNQLSGYGYFFKVRSGEIPDIPEHLSPACFDFIKRCLQFNPKHRPTASELLRHPFVANAPTSSTTPGDGYVVESFMSTSPRAFYKDGANVHVLPPALEDLPRQQQSHRLDRNSNRSMSNPCNDARDARKDTQPPRTSPPTPGHGRNDHGW